MAADSEGDSQLEIAHALRTDIVGHSKLLTNEQRERQQELNRVVRSTGSSGQRKPLANWSEYRPATGWFWRFSPPPDAPRASCGGDQLVRAYAARRIRVCGWESIADRSTWSRT